MPAQALESHSEPLEERSRPTGIPISDAGKIESAKPKTKLRFCANPLYPALLEIARKKKKDLELLFTIPWSINTPPSLRALPRVARNLRRSLLILQLRRRAYARARCSCRARGQRPHAVFLLSQERQ
jgi:hypothetical protein